MFFLGLKKTNEFRRLWKKFYAKAQSFKVYLSSDQFGDQENEWIGLIYCCGHVRFHELVNPLCVSCLFLFTFAARSIT